MTDETLTTYNRSAKELAKYFKGIGARTKDIELAFKFAARETDQLSVLEIGCGDGRDAREIVSFVKTYKGLDYSAELIKLARELVPNADFVVEGMLEFAYPKNVYDVIFAFASLLHISQDKLLLLLPHLAGSLRNKGVFYLSLKYNGSYKEEWKQDQFGKRLFYYYNPDIIAGLTEDWFEVLHVNRGIIGRTEWFEMAPRKK